MPSIVKYCDLVQRLELARFLGVVIREAIFHLLLLFFALVKTTDYLDPTLTKRLLLSRLMSASWFRDGVD